MLKKPEDYDFDNLYSSQLSNIQLNKFLLRHVEVGDFCHWHQRIELFIEQIINKLDLPTNPEFLDLGCQLGTFSIELAKRGHNTTGVDLSKDALKVANLLSEKLGLEKRPNFVLADISDPSIFKEGSFDVIMAEDIFEHLHQDILEKTIENCAKWLKPGGYLVYHTHPTKYDYLFHSRGWKSSLRLLPAMVVSLIHGERKFKKFIEWYHNAIINKVTKLTKGKTQEELILHNPHCNLLTKKAVCDLMEANRLQSIGSQTENLYDRDRSRFPIRRLFFNKREYFHRNIYGIAWKPYKELS
jgi:cyclopropane fatty-acyl-phospholipid synthase-like methyltransferase